MTRKSLETNSSHFFFPVQGEVAARSVAGSVRSTRRWASLRQHVAANEGGKPRVELLLDPPGSKPSTPSSPQPHTPNTPRTPHTPSRKSNWEVIEHFTGAPRPSIVTVSWHRYDAAECTKWTEESILPFHPIPLRTCRNRSN